MISETGTAIPGCTTNAGGHKARIALETGVLVFAKAGVA